MKHKAFTVVEAIVVVVILAILAAILFPMFARSRESCGPRNSCPSNLKQIGLGFAQYTQDYDAKFPPTQNALGGWADIVQPYIKSYYIFQCPSDENRADKTSDYYFNSRLAGASAKRVLWPVWTISLGDGVPDQPLDANLSQLPTAWRNDSNSPAHRHLDGANYAFADGHVKWFKPQNITLNKPSSQKPTFEVKP